MIVKFVKHSVFEAKRSLFQNDITHKISTGMGNSSSGDQQQQQQQQQRKQCSGSLHDGIRTTSSTKCVINRAVTACQNNQFSL